MSRLTIMVLTIWLALRISIERQSPFRPSPGLSATLFQRERGWYGAYSPCVTFFKKVNARSASRPGSSLFVRSTVSQPR